MVYSLSPNQLYERKDREPEVWKPQHLGLYRYLPDAYWYYDTPDGQDCLSKMWFCMKAGAVIGGVASVYDVLMFTKPIGYANVAFRFSHAWLIPAMAVGAMYSASVCTSLDLRKKDDKFNQVVGAVVGGCVWGAARSCLKQGFVMSLALANVGLAFKDREQFKWDSDMSYRRKEWGFFPTFTDLDFTLTKDERFDDRTSDRCYKNTKWGFIAPTADLS